MAKQPAQRIKQSSRLLSLLTVLGPRVCGGKDFQPVADRMERGDRGHKEAGGLRHGKYSQGNGLQDIRLWWAKHDSETVRRNRSGGLSRQIRKSAPPTTTSNH